MEGVGSGKEKVKRLRFSDKENTEQLSRLSGSSSLSQISSKRYSGTKRGKKRKESSQLGILAKSAERASTKEAFSEDLNPMWFIKHQNEAALRTCLSFDSRVFMFDRDKRASMRRHGPRKRRLDKKISYYPVAKYFVYKNDLEAWYRGGIQFDFQAYTPKYIPDDLCFKTFLKKNGKSKVFDDEVKARNYSLKHTSKVRVENAKGVRKNFEARLQRVYKTISTTKRCLELIEEVNREFKITLESGNNRKITEESQLLDDEYFNEAFLSYLKMSFINKAIEKTSMSKLFAHKYLYVEPEKARESLMELLAKLIDSEDFTEYSVPDGHVIAFRKLSVLYLRNKFFSRQDTRKARKLYQEESSLSKESFDANYRNYSYVDVMSQDVLEAEMFAMLYPKTELSEDWTNIDLQSFLMNPRKAWLFEKTRWALNLVKLINSGLITALVNNNVELRNALMHFEIPNSIAEQIDYVQACVTNYVHKEEKRTEKETRLRKQQSSTESILFNNRKSLKSGFPSEYFFQVENELDIQDLLPIYHSLLSPSSKNLVVQQVRGLRNKVDGFRGKKHPFEAYVESNAYSLWLNPIVRADLHFSRRRSSCRSDCSGHRGKLLLTLIRMGELESVQCLLQNSVKPNIKVCTGQTKDLIWVDTVFYTSQREALLKNHISESVSQSKRWQEKYKKVLAGGMNFFMKTDECSIEDTMNLENKDAKTLKSRYSKSSPLGIALTCFGYDLFYKRDIVPTQQMISCLVEAGAKMTFNNNFGIRCLIPYVETTVANQRKHRLVRRQTKEQNKEAQRRLTEHTQKRRGSIFSRIMTSIGLKHSHETRSTKFSSAESLEDINRHEVFSYNRGSIDNAEIEDFISQILNKCKDEVAFEKVDRSSLLFDLKWTILVRVSLLYECLLQEKYDLFRTLAPYSSTFCSRSRAGTLRPKTTKSEVDDVDPVTAECLFNLLDLLTVAVTKATSTLFPKYLHGIYFVLQEYNLLPTRPQLSTIMASISKHIRSNLYCLPQTERTIMELLQTGQIQYALYFEASEFYRQRQITAFALYPHERRSLQLTHSRRWKRQARRIRRKVMRIALRGQLFETFQFMFDKEGLRHFNPDKLTSSFIDSLLLSKDSTNLSEMLRLMENRFSVSSDNVAQPILQDCIEKQHAVHLIGALVDLDIYPSPFLCKTYLLNTMMHNPLMSSDGKHMQYDRTADLTKVKVFHKFLNHMLNNERAKELNPKEVLDTLLFHSVWLTELVSKIQGQDTESREFLWYEGIQSVVGHLENYNLKLRRNNRGYDKYTVLKKEIKRMRNLVAQLIDGHVHQDMFYLEDEQKVVMKSTEEEDSKRPIGKLNSSLGNSISEIHLGSFLGDKANNIMMFAEAMAVSGF